MWEDCFQNSKVSSVNFYISISNSNYAKCNLQISSLQISSRLITNHLLTTDSIVPTFQLVHRTIIPESIQIKGQFSLPIYPISRSDHARPVVYIRKINTLHIHCEATTVHHARSTSNTFQLTYCVKHWELGWRWPWHGCRCWCVLSGVIRYYEEFIWINKTYARSANTKLGHVEELPVTCL